MHHDGGNRGGVGAQITGEIGRHAAPAHQFVIAAPVVAVARIVFRVHQIEIAAPDQQARAFAAAVDHLGAADQDRHVVGVLQHRLAARSTRSSSPSAKTIRRVAARAASNTGRMITTERKTEPSSSVAIGLQIDRARRHAGFHRGLGNGTATVGIRRGSNGLGIR